MGIKIFVAVVFILSLISLVNVKMTNTIQTNNEEIPQVSFYDTTMYTLNHNRVTRVVDAKNAYIYATKETMEDGVITNFVDEANIDLKDVLRAKNIVKEGDVFTFIGDVKLDRGDFFSLQTQELFYNQKDEIVYNDIIFTSIYEGDILNGKSLYMDNKKGILNAKESHFEIRTN